MAGESDKDLSVTALYTSHTWFWAGFKHAALFISKRSRNVYFITNFFRFIGTLLNWRLPSLRYSLAQRHALIDRLLERSKSDQIIEIAAGLSRRGACFSEDSSVQYTELDISTVVAQKRGILSTSETGRAILARENFRLIAGDALTTNLDALAQKDQPVTVIAEGLLIYLNAEEQRTLWKKVAAMRTAAKSVAFLFDFVPTPLRPRRSWLGAAVERLIKSITKGGEFVRDQRTVEDITRELTDCGFKRVETYDTHEVANKWGLPGADKRTSSIVWMCRA